MELKFSPFILKCITVSFSIFIFGGGIVATSLLRAPANSKVLEKIVVTKDNIDEMGGILKEKGFVRSAFLFDIVRRAFRTPLIAGGYMISRDMNVVEVVRAFSLPDDVFVTLPENLSKQNIAEIIGGAFFWDERRKTQFIYAWEGMFWQRFRVQIEELLRKDFDFSEEEIKTFSALYVARENDFFNSIYIAGDYLLNDSQSPAQIVEEVMKRIEENHKTDMVSYLASRVDKEKIENLYARVQKEIELLPDLIPLPASDVRLDRSGSRSLLVFTTTYWNKGRGQFELIADPATRGTEGDFNRDVFQRIYRRDGTYREKLVGNFLWHDQHLHYHYNDFIEYELKPITASFGTTTTEILSGLHKKATFCVRDVEHIDAEFPGSPREPVFTICWKARQGISVGWGDSYFFTYPDQNLDVSKLPSGVYELSFLVNPKHRFDEISIENNRSSVLLNINSVLGTLEVMGTRGESR